MFYSKTFELLKEEIMLVYKTNDISIETNWSLEGKMQEKGIDAENLILKLLSLCNVEVLKSQRSSVLDEILKVDIVFKDIEFKDVYAFQVKSSLTGAAKHHEKYGSEIKYKKYYFRTPWCLIVDGSKTNQELLDLFIEEFCLDCLVDFDKVRKVQKKVLNSNNKRIRINSVPKLNKTNQRALLLLFNIGKNSETYFLKS